MKVTGATVGFWMSFGIVVVNLLCLAAAARTPLLDELKTLFFVNMLCGLVGCFANWLLDEKAPPKE